MPNPLSIIVAELASTANEASDVERLWRYPHGFDIAAMQLWQSGVRLGDGF